MKLIVNGQGRLNGYCSVPSDKSISHRSLMLGVLAQSEMVIHNLLPSADVLSTLSCLKQLGFSIEENDGIRIHPEGHRLQHDQILDCGNSGTTMRLLTGLLAPMGLSVVLDGDESLRRRPMARVTKPLCQMGAQTHAQDNGCAPIRISPTETLQYADIQLPVASAQLKSACLLMGLQGAGCTVRGGGNSRDHTEIMLKSMGAKLATHENGTVSIHPGKLNGIELSVPGDFSSAAFVLSAALILPHSSVCIEGVNLNPTRTGLLDLITAMGAHVEVSLQSTSGEATGQLTVQHSSLHGLSIPEAWIPRLIDELPIIAVLATQAKGQTIIRGAHELRYKESDRISTTVSMLKAFGAVVEELDDGLIIEGPQQLRAGVIDPDCDHRIAMAAAVAALCASGQSTILNAECISVSFPAFSNLFSSLGAVMTCTEV